MNLKQFCDKYGYRLIDKIPENWDRYNDGTPSVTAILSLLYDKGFEYVKRNYSKSLKDAAKRGTIIHNNADKFFEGGGVIHRQILKAHILYDIEPIEREKNYRSDIQGTIDLVGYATINGERKIYNIDYKSSLNQSPKYKLQLAGYKYLNGNDGCILYLSDKKFVLDTFDTNEYLEAFIELKDYFIYLLGQRP